MKQQKYYDELTVISGFAILFVLAIHGCGSALQSFYAGSTAYADTGLFLRTISNLVAPAVPMFLFVSGFKYAANDAQTPYFTFLKKRLPRVLMSFAILNTLFWALDSIKYMETLDIILLAKTYLHSWAGYSVAYQLWYIPMYCCVVVVCPLVRRIIPSTLLRFCIYAIIGILQRILEAEVTVLATYPIRFISYPVFFEMGVLAQEKEWQNKISAAAGILGGTAYTLLVLLFSWALPHASANELTKYILYYFAGTAVMFAVSLSFKTSRVLQWLGAVSYPVFLLHEPLIGRCMTLILNKFGIQLEVLWLLFWVAIVLLVSVMVVRLLEKMQLDRILWKFKL